MNHFVPIYLVPGTWYLVCLHLDNTFPWLQVFVTLNKRPRAGYSWVAHHSTHARSIIAFLLLFRTNVDLLMQHLSILYLIRFNRTINKRYFKLTRIKIENHLNKKWMHDFKVKKTEILYFSNLKHPLYSVIEISMQVERSSWFISK